MMKPLSTAAQAYSIVLHEESQRQVHSNNQICNDASAFSYQWTEVDTTKESVRVKRRKYTCCYRWKEE